MAEKIDYKSLSKTDLDNRLKETREELILGRRNFRLGKFKKTSEFPRLRREIARINTFLRSLAIKAKAA